MSNHLAIATVTATLRRLLGEAATVVPGAAVTTKRPDGNPAAAQGAAINVFMYQVVPNAAYRNTDLPTRRVDGELAQRPCAALVLHYLISFAGEDEKLEPQRLMGAAVRRLHARPQLTGADIAGTLANPPYDALLAQSNLQEQVDLVRFTPLGLSLDELSKVWSVFFQTPYVLSVAYQAGPVLIETEDEPRSALPVQVHTVEALPFRQPFIEEIVAEDGSAQIFATSTLVLRGKRLRADAVFVLLGGAEVTPKSVSEREVTLAIPVGTRAGAHGLQLLHKLLLGPEPKSLHRGFESNVATFVLTPRITGLAAVAGPALNVNVDVIVGKDQRVSLLLDGTAAANPPSASLLARARPGDTSSVVFDVDDVAAGQYFARVQIDGAASPLDLVQGSPTFGPTVTLP